MVGEPWHWYPLPSTAWQPAPPQRGWECPKCGRCFAPWVLECSHCGKGAYDFIYQPVWQPTPTAINEPCETKTDTTKGIS